MANSPPPLKLITTPQKGRSLVSTKPLLPGEIILTDTPILLYSAVPHTSTSKYCSNCFKTLIPKSQIPCPNCPNNPSFFCSSKCISSHSQFVCQTLNNLFSPFSPLLQHSHDTHLQARFLVSAFDLSRNDQLKFQSLVSLQGEPGDYDKAVFFNSLFCSISDRFVEFSVEVIAGLLVKDKVNAFGLMEGEGGSGVRGVRAYGIYPKASFFNHDCLPNACRFDYVDDTGNGNNTDIVVRVLHDVDEGREICISYFPVNFKYSERQKRLKEDYGFVCDCDRCNVEANWSDNEEGEENDDEDNMDEGDGEDDDMGSGLEEGEDSGGMVDGNGNEDFPHAYFFLRYMCSRENCGGTLAPLPPSGGRALDVMECNVCGNLSKCEDMDGN